MLTLSLQCYVIVEYPTNVIPSMLCYCRISHKRYPFNVMLLLHIERYPFNVMLLSNIRQNVIPSMLCYCRISYKRYPFNVMLLLLSNIL